MDRKTLPNRIKSYLVVHIKTTAGVFRLLMVLLLLAVSACTENKTINQGPPVTSQAGPDTRTDTDWGGGGTGDGGGGQGISCSQDVKEASLRGQLLVRDVYEAKYNYRRKLISSTLGAAGTDSVDEQTYEFLLSVLQQHFGPMMLNSDFGNKQFWKDFVGKISFVPEGASLYPSRDANSPLALPKGCRIAQIAFWDESGVTDGGILYVDKAIWTNLDQFNKAALLLHEYFFKLAREAGFKNSDYARYNVGYLLAENGPPAMFPKWSPSKLPSFKGMLPESSKGYKYCVGRSPQQPDSFLEYYQYQIANGNQQIVVPTIKTSTFTMPPFQFASIQFDPDEMDYYNVGVVTDTFYSRRQQQSPINELIYTSGESSKPNGLQEYSGDLFSTSFKTKSGEGKFTIRNPWETFTAKESPNLKSRDELIVLLNQMAEKILNNAIEKFTEPGANVLELISVLNKEIDDSIKTGTYPAGFPKWRNAMERLIGVQGKYKGVELLLRNLDVGQSAMLMKTIPDVLYRIKVGSYSKDDVKSSLGDLGFVNPKVKPSAQLSVSVADTTVDFEINCKDYYDYFLQFTNQPMDTLKMTPVNSSISVLSNTDLQGADLVKEYLSNGKLNDVQAQNRFFAYTGETCGDSEKYKKDECRTMLEFLKEMSSNETVEIQSCGSLNIYNYFELAETDSKYMTVCYMFDFKKTRQKFIAKAAFHNGGSRDYESVIGLWGTTEVMLEKDPTKAPFLDRLERIPYDTPVSK